MIRPEQIPDDVVEAAAMAVYEAWCKFHGVNATSMPWIDIDDEERQACFAEATVALIAGLEAWPGGWIDTLEEAAGVRRTIILPLHQEAGEEAKRMERSDNE